MKDRRDAAPWVKEAISELQTYIHEKFDWVHYYEDGKCWICGKIDDKPRHL